MVKCFIQLNLPKHYITLNIILIFNTINLRLSDYNEIGNSMKNPFTLPLLMFIGQSLVYFFYFYQKKYYLNNIERNIKMIKLFQIIMMRIIYQNNQLD